MHLVVGTPMYGGMCCSEYVQSMLQLQSDMERSGHSTKYAVMRSTNSRDLHQGS